MSGMLKQLKPKPLSSILMLALLVSMLVISLSIPPTQAQEADIFRDDFESYAVGTFPSAGGWILVWNGKGNQYQVITDARYHSSRKSFQLWGTYGWSAHAERHFSTTASHRL